MSDSDSPETSIPKETPAPISWTEIRNKYLNSSFSETYGIAIDAFRRWEALPDKDIPEWIVDNQIAEQAAKARELPKMPRVGAKTHDAKRVVKISTVGTEKPPDGQGTMTRIYIGVDPRKATDAYTTLLDELEANGVIKDIDASLNMEELVAKMVTGNMMIIYEPQSRPEVLDKVLAAYQAAKQKHPEHFALTPQQKAKIMRWNLRSFHGTLDANLSFVEQPALREGKSFDTYDRVEIQKAFGITTDWFQLSDLEFCAKTKGGETRVVYDAPTRYKLERNEIKSGDILKYERRLSAPALIQEGTITAK